MRPRWPPTWIQPWTGLLSNGGVAEVTSRDSEAPGASGNQASRDALGIAPRLDYAQDTAPAPGHVPVWHSSAVSPGRLAIGVGAIGLVVVLVLGVSQAAKESSA